MECGLQKALKSVSSRARHVTSTFMEYLALLIDHHIITSSMSKDLHTVMSDRTLQFRIS